MSGILKAARDHINLRLQHDGRKPTSIALDPELFRRVEAAAHDYVEITAKYFLETDAVSLERTDPRRNPDGDLTYFGVDFFPDPNGIKAF